MKEPADHKDVEGFFSGEFSKELKREVLVSVQWVDYQDLDDKSPPYHKEISRRNVSEIGEDFCAVVAGFLCVNIREPSGKTVLVDGRHRMQGSEKKGFKGWWCLVTHGLTVEEEAMLFRYFDKRKRMSASEALRGLIYEKDATALGLQGAVHSSGYKFVFDGERKGKAIYAVGALMELYADGGTAAIKRVLRILDRAYSAEPASLVSTMVRGVWSFVSHQDVKGKLDEDWLVERIRTMSPLRMVSEARVTAATHGCGSGYGVAEEMRKLYNKQLHGRARIGIDFARDKTVGRASSGFRRTILEPSEAGWLSPAPDRPTGREKMTRNDRQIIYRELHRKKRVREIQEHYHVSKWLIDRIRAQGVKENWPTGPQGGAEASA